MAETNFIPTPYGDSENEPGGGGSDVVEIPVPSMEAETGKPNSRQRLFGFLGWFTDGFRRKYPEAFALAAIAEEVSFIRTVAPALDTVSLALAGQDAQEEVLDPDTGDVLQEARPFVPGLIDVLLGFEAYTDGDGVARDGYEGLVLDIPAGLEDLGWIREAFAGVRDAEGARTGPGVFERVLRTGVEALVGPLAADGSATGTGDVRVATNGLKSLVAALGPAVAADGTASGASEITTIRTTLEAILAELTNVRGEIASLGVDVAGLGGDVDGIESTLSGALGTMNGHLANLVTETAANT